MIACTLLIDVTYLQLAVAGKSQRGIPPVSTLCGSWWCLPGWEAAWGGFCKRWLVLCAWWDTAALGALKPLSQQGCFFNFLLPRTWQQCGRSACRCCRKMGIWANTPCENEETHLGAVLDSHALLSGLLISDFWYWNWLGFVFVGVLFCFEVGFFKPQRFKVSS